MKKVIAVLLIVSMFFSLAGCAAPAAESTSAPAPAPATEVAKPEATETKTEDKKPLIAFDAAEVGIPYFTTMHWGALEAAKDYDVDLYWTGSPLWELSAQMPFIEGAIAMNPDGLALVPTDDVALVTYVKEWTDSGLPVICVDVALQEPVATQDYDSNQYSGGVEAAKGLFAMNGAGGTYVAFGAHAGDYTSEQRCSGFIDTMKELDPTATILDTLYPGSETAKAAELASAAIIGNPELTGMYASQSAVAAGVASAVIEQGKGGTIKIASYDADPQQITDLRDGVYDVLIAQDPFHMGYDAVANLAKLARGEVTKADFPDQVVHYPMFAITRDNMETEEAQKFMYIEDLTLVGYTN